MNRVDIVKRWFISWAERNDPRIHAIICFGSNGIGGEKSPSELDLCVVGKNIGFCDLKYSLQFETNLNCGLCYLLPEKNKLVAILFPESLCFRLNCFFVKSISECAYCIVGCESILKMNRSLLYKHPEHGLESEKWLASSKKSVKDISHFLREEVMKFIESFETACSKRVQSDKFQFWFQMTLAFIALVKLESVRKEENKFLGLPKYARVDDSSSKHLFEEIFGPRNHELAQQEEYIHQFKKTVACLVSNGMLDLEGIGSVEEICRILTMVLDHDRFCNFRDAAIGKKMQKGCIYRSRFSEVPALAEMLSIATVFDLRSEDEARENPLLQLPQTTAYFHIDLMGCSGCTAGINSESSLPPCCYGRLASDGRGALGMALRALSAANLPLLLFCGEGKNSTGIVSALLQLLCRAPREAIIDDYCKSLQGGHVQPIELFLDGVGNNVEYFLLTCGLSPTDILALQSHFFRPEVGEEVSQILKSPEMFNFRAGFPSTACRPFLECERKMMKFQLFRGVPTQLARPIAFVISGLPASGKSSICQQVVESMGIRIQECVNIDMDLVRPFHCQYQSFSHEPENPEVPLLTSYEQLVSWFNEGTDIEHELYRKPDGVVQSLLGAKCNFILPTVMDNEKTLQFLKNCVHDHGYRLCLVGVHVSMPTSLTRAISRAKQTGRYVPPNIIEGRSCAIEAAFFQTSKFVMEVGGTVFLYDNNTDKSAMHTSPLIDSLVFSHSERSTCCVDPAICSMYGLEKSLFPCPEINSDVAVPRPATASLQLQYQTDGCLAVNQCIPRDDGMRMGLLFEKSISDFAQACQMSRADYLSVINRWPHFNSQVMDMMELLGTILRHKVADILSSNVAWPVGAVVFRKSTMAAEAGTIPTHPHQDISYARFPGSQLFQATTWVPLLLENADTLCFAKGSHKQGIQDAEDFLLQGRHKKSSAVNCNTIMTVCLGDCIIFDARVWHASTPFLGGNAANSLRLAIGIQWLTPSELHDFIPKIINLDALKREEVFCMDTAGWFLKRALIKLDAKECTETAEKVYSTLKLASTFSETDNLIAVDKLCKAGCDVTKAQDALKLYILFRKASKYHFGQNQGPKIFQPLYDHLIKPLLFPTANLEVFV